MRMLPAQEALGGCARAVVIDGDPRLHQSERDIVFLHAEYGALGEPIILDQDVEQGLDRLLAPQLRDGREGLALQGTQGRVLDHADENGFGSGNLVPLVIPRGARRFDVLGDPRPRGRILQALHHFVIAAVVGPGGTNADMSLNQAV